MSAGKPNKLTVLEYVSNGKLKRKPLKKMSASERAYYRDLHNFVDRIFQEAYDVYGWDWNDLATEAQLSSQTTRSLGKRKTRFPRFQTIYKLAKAVGWQLVLQERKKRLPKQAA